MKIHVFWDVQDVRVTSYRRKFAVDLCLPWIRR